MKEPGQIAYEAHETQYPNQPYRPWLIVGDAERAVWAAVEAAIRADEAAKVIDECAKVMDKRAKLYREIKTRGLDPLAPDTLNAYERAISNAEASEWGAAAIRAKGAEHG